MSEFNEFTTSDSEVWEDLATLSRRIINLEQRLLERILVLEAEVAALKASRSDAQPQGQESRGIYPDARIIEWREDGAALATIDGIMQRGDV
jgi:hypothetical protein